MPKCWYHACLQPAAKWLYLDGQPWIGFCGVHAATVKQTLRHPSATAQLGPFYHDRAVLLARVRRVRAPNPRTTGGKREYSIWEGDYQA